MESPWSWKIAEQLVLHRAYLAAAIRDALSRRESVYASHAIYCVTGALDDDDPSQRRTGLDAGHAWRAFAPTIAYGDFGVSRGMQEGLDASLRFGWPSEPIRYLPGWEEGGPERARAIAEAGL